ncbi:MAG: hypothetical protein LBC53_09225 [Spirochaetaceae bacterium]|jgi:hypothetical protein|nr:hypothetical protein [Spirochaetaceae bacterium]
MTCTNPVFVSPRGYTGYVRLPGTNLHKVGLFVPCGKCMACRIARSREWSVRLFHELHYHEKSMFLTLTYDDEHLPPHGSLRKSDLTKFWKRLRKRLGNRRIKYFACGEYGSLTERPHYHAVIFGLQFYDLEDQCAVIASWPFCDWNLARVKSCSERVCFESIKYVTRYIQKKLSGSVADSVYIKSRREPPFQVQSSGLGLRFALDNAKQIESKLDITLRGAHVGVPRYYRKKLNIDPGVFRRKAMFANLDFIQSVSVKYPHFRTSLSPTDFLHFCDSVELADAFQRDLNIKARQSLLNPGIF